MKFEQFMMYFGVTLMMGCSVGAAFAVVLWLLLPMTSAEGLGATTLFASLACLGYLAFKITPPKPKHKQEMPTVA